ncbi:unnamed protein product [Mesocestoides corti]|uniref:PTS fructose transporter subunit IIA n=1 Tax=Mesocestoides corti TaxID=53468 RepID=A0A0R3UDC3_MESCO|nr:unnamed protein product [Mesocestoides corti]
MAGRVDLLVTLDNCYRSQSALSQRRVLQMSALSTFDDAALAAAAAVHSKLAG